MKQVSRMFEQHLGKSYIASLHWTSPLRTRAGHLPFHSEDETASTFTIDDHTGGLVNTLRHPYRDTNPSHQARLFHIEVIASEGGLGDKFCLDPDQVQKVRNVQAILIF